MADRLDILIFGATGFTGKFCLIEAIGILKDFKWGVAGRNKEKLIKILKNVSEELKTDLSHVAIVVADVNDEQSLISMAEQTKVIVNCVGPYRVFGEQVVKACIATSTHYVDISAEPQFMERMQLEYDHAAKQKGAYIVSACGFASIPADLGVAFIENNFDGVVNSVELYMQPSFDKSLFGPLAHFGTWESLLTALAHSNELPEIRSKLFKENYPITEPKLKRKITMCRSSKVNAFYFPFPGIDESVVCQSQRIFYETERKRPIQIIGYLAFGPFFHYFGALLGLFFLWILSRFSCGMWLLLKYPKLMSLGFITHEGPTKERMEQTKVIFSLFAEGWKKDETLQQIPEKCSIPTNKKLTVKVTCGPSPGYGATSIAILLSAVTILREQDCMPNKGGVYPPGAVFAKTNIFSELEKYNGFKFEIVDTKDNKFVSGF